MCVFAIKMKSTVKLIQVFQKHLLLNSGPVADTDLVISYLIYDVYCYDGTILIQLC